MPITDKASYLTTATAFLTHWGAVNVAMTALGQTPFLLTVAGIGAGGQPQQDFGVLELEALRNMLNGRRQGVAAALTDVALARADYAEIREKLVERHGQFNANVRGQLAGSKWARVQVDVVSADEGLQSISTATSRVLALWQRLNASGALPSPLVLRDAYSAATFEADMITLVTAANAVSAAEHGLRMDREERNDIEDAIYAALKAYRAVMPTLFIETNALVESLPALSPAPGSTPAAVQANAAWDVPSAKAKVEWTPTTASDVDHYELRATPGDAYDADDAVTVATIAPGAAREALSATFFVTPGMKVTYKVYVVTTTGNEAGSNAVTVTRPH